MMPVPVVGTQTGPQYAVNINSCLDIIDQHDHTSGKGLQVPTAGININADLAFNGYKLTGLNALTDIDTQGSALNAVTYPKSVYVTGGDGDLYFNDDNGNQIQLTASGAVAGTPGSITGLVSPATATYSTGSETFKWSSHGANDKPALMDCGSLKIRETVNAGNGITIAPDASISSDYSLTLPAAPPASQAALLINNSGVVSAPIPSIQVSSSCAAFTTTNTSFTAVTNLSVSITTNGRPVVIALVGDDSDQSLKGFSAYQTAGGGLNSVTADGRIGLLRDSTYIAYDGVYARVEVTGTANLDGVQSNAVNNIYFIDTPAAGTYTYSVKVRRATGTSVSMRYMKLMAYEIK